MCLLVQQDLFINPKSITWIKQNGKSKNKTKLYSFKKVQRFTFQHRFKSKHPLTKNEPRSLLLIIKKSLDLCFLTSSVIPLITALIVNFPSRWRRLGLPPFYLPLHSLISHQSPISAHKDPGRVRRPQVTSARVSSCAQGRSVACDWPKVMARGGAENVGKKKIFLKGW